VLSISIPKELWSGIRFSGLADVFEEKAILGQEVVVLIVQAFRNG